MEELEQSWAKHPLLRNLVKFGLGFVVIVFYVTVVLHFGYTPDDTFIYLQFARNLLQGNGFAFNPGESTYGVASPLWVFLIAAGGLLKLDLFLVAKILSLVFASVVLLLFYRLGYEVLRDHLYAFLATFVFSVNACFLQWAGSGMEMSLSMLLVLLAVYYCLRNEYMVASLSSAVLTLVRPEGILLFFFILLDEYWNSLDKRRALYLMLNVCGLYLVVLSSWLIYVWMNFRTIIPNAIVANTNLHLGLKEYGLVAWALIKTLSISNGVEFILLVVGVVVVFRKKDFEIIRRYIIPLSWMVSLIILSILAESNALSTSLLLVIPFVVLYGFLGLQQIQESFSAIQRFGHSTVLLISAVLLVQNQFMFQKYVKPHMQSFSDGMTECLIPIGMWLKENTPKHVVVVASDIGAIGYYSHRKLCDMEGIITPEIARIRCQGKTYDEIMTKKLYLSVCYPDYVVDRAEIPERLADEQLIPVFSRIFNGLGLEKNKSQHYTVYKVLVNVSPKAELFP